MQRQILVEDEDCPYLGPDEVDAFVSVSYAQVETLDYFLPCQRVDKAIQEHEKQKYI